MGVATRVLVRDESLGTESADKSFGRRGGRGGTCGVARGGGLGLQGGDSLEPPEHFPSW